MTNLDFSYLFHENLLESSSNLRDINCIHISFVFALLSENSNHHDCMKFAEFEILISFKCFCEPFLNLQVDLFYGPIAQVYEADKLWRLRL